MALEDELRELRTRRSNAQAKVVRAQTEHDSAVSRKEIADRTLEEDFGVTTDAEGRAKLLELKAVLDDKKAEIESKLEEAGA